MGYSSRGCKDSGAAECVHTHSPNGANLINIHLKGGGWFVTRRLSSQPSANQHFVSNLLR